MVRNHTLTYVTSVAQCLGYFFAPHADASLSAAQFVRVAFLLPAGTNAFSRMLHARIASHAALLPAVECREETDDGFDPPALARRLVQMGSQIEGVGT